MNALITGGAGYIGSVCVEAWVEAGHRVVVLDDLSEGHRQAVHPEAELVVGSTGRREDLREAFGRSRPEVVAHFAASALVGESMKRPGDYFRNNVGGSLELLEACVERRVRKLVFSSSCSVYGVPERIPVDEECPARPVSPYGESKRMVEGMLEWYRRIHGLDFAAFRYFNACGATARCGEDHRVETHLVPSLIQACLGRRENARIFGTDYPTPDGTCIRDYVHVADLAQAHLLAAQAPLSGFHNLGTGRGHSVREVIAACEKVSGKPIPVVEEGRREGDPPRLVAALSSRLAELGWKPRHADIATMVESAWQWHRAHPRGYGG